MANRIQWPERDGPRWPLYPKCTVLESADSSADSFQTSTFLSTIPTADSAKLNHDQDYITDW